MDNNAICISGDFESESMIELIDKYFGGFESKEVPNFEVIKERPIEKIIERSGFDEVMTADQDGKSSDCNSIKDAIQARNTNR